MAGGIVKGRQGTGQADAKWETVPGIRKRGGGYRKKKKKAIARTTGNRFDWIKWIVRILIEAMEWAGNSIEILKLWTP